MTDKGTGAENLIWLAKRQGGLDPASLQADDILAALTGRIAELEARVTAILADVASEPPSVESNANTRRVDDTPLAVNAELSRASEERRTLAKEMRLLRETIQEAGLAQPSPPVAAKAPTATDLRSAVADEMRSLLSELLADFRSRTPAPPPVEQVVVKSETAAAARTVEIIVEEPRAVPVVDVASPEPAMIVEQIDELLAATIEAPIEAPIADIAQVTETSSILEDVDELVRPATKPLSEFVADPHEAELIEPAPATLEEIEEVFAAESTVIETVELQEVASPEPAEPIVDEAVYGHAEAVAPLVEDYVAPPSWPDITPVIETFDGESAVVEPIEPTVEEIAEIPQPEAPTAPEWIQADATTEPVDLPADTTEPTEPIAHGYVEDVAPQELTQEPPPVDERLAALWDAAPLPAEPETAPTPEPEPISFLAEELVADTPPLDIPDVSPEQYPPQELAPEQTIDYVPPPLIESAPPTPYEFVAEPAIEQPASTQSFSSLFPELTVADPKGLHEIQVVISPIHSFPRLIETERRIRALSTVNALHLRDFRNGVATLTVSVGEAISPAEFGAVIQMLESLHLRLEGTTQTGVELRAEDEPPSD